MMEKTIFSTIQIVMGAALLISGMMLALNAFSGIPDWVIVCAVALLYLKDAVVIVISSVITANQPEGEPNNE